MKMRCFCKRRCVRGRCDVLSRCPTSALMNKTPPAGNVQSGDVKTSISISAKLPDVEEILRHITTFASSVVLSSLLFCILLVTICWVIKEEANLVVLKTILWFAGVAMAVVVIGIAIITGIALNAICKGALCCFVNGKAKDGQKEGQHGSES